MNKKHSKTLLVRKAKDSSALWFKAKHYGWGWYPSSWQGGIIILVYLVSFFLLASIRDLSRLTAQQILLTVVLPIIVLTALLIWICYKTGEKPRWRWGKK